MPGSKAELQATIRSTPRPRRAIGGTPNQKRRATGTDDLAWIARAVGMDKLNERSHTPRGRGTRATRPIGATPLETRRCDDVEREVEGSS
eukprot:4442445-Pyramimonas_sp.AAC.2